MRVFVSSVILGFEEWRAAARRAVELTNNAPIMAEDFGARAESPQEACLEGVRGSDVYLLLLGARYGTRGTSGIAPTEEEYEEARRLHLPMLVFVAKAEMDSDQQQFLRRVRGSWDAGNLYGEISSVAQLRDEIIKSLSRLNQQGSAGLAAPPAGFDSLFELHDARNEDVVLRVAWIPDTRRQLITLDAVEQVGDQMSKVIRGVGLLDGTRRYLKERTVEFVRAGSREYPTAAVEVFDDLRIVYVVGLRNPSRGFGMASLYYIDRRQLIEVVASAMRTFLRPYRDS